MLFVLLWLAVCFSAVWILCFRRKLNTDPPELSGCLPILGMSHKFLGGSIKNYKLITELSEECTQKGGIVTTYFGLMKAYIVTDPEAILMISNMCINRPYQYNFFKLFFGDGLITASGPTWKKHRKLLSPAFSQNVLNSFTEILNKQARVLVDMLALNLGKPFDYEATLRRNNLQTICLTAMGINSSDDYGRLQDRYINQFPKVLQNLNERSLRIWLHNDFVYNLSNSKKEFEKVFPCIADLSNSIFQNKKNEMNSVNENYDKQNTGKVKSFLEFMLDITNEDKCFTDDEVREEMDTIIAAGHETTACTINLALIVLGSHPEVQDKVYEEIQHVMGDSDKDIDKDDFSKLGYTEAVLKETMRLYPLLPLVARDIDTDVKLKNYTLKANSSCVLSIYGLNRHPIWGSDADQFRPERWFNATLPDSNYFSSFGWGRRICIGRVYAMMKMKTILAFVLRKYRVHSDISKLVLKWQALTYPASGQHCVLELRNT